MCFLAPKRAGELMATSPRCPKGALWGCQPQLHTLPRPHARLRCSQTSGTGHNLRCLSRPMSPYPVCGGSSMARPVPRPQHTARHREPRAGCCGPARGTRLRRHDLLSLLMLSFAPYVVRSFAACVFNGLLGHHTTAFLGLPGKQRGNK